jgi:hypothetical protein
LAAGTISAEFFGCYGFCSAGQAVSSSPEKQSGGHSRVPRTPPLILRRD